MYASRTDLRMPQTVRFSNSTTEENISSPAHCRSAVAANNSSIDWWENTFSSVPRTITLTGLDLAYLAKIPSNSIETASFRDPRNQSLRIELRGTAHEGWNEGTVFILRRPCKLHTGRSGTRSASR